MKSCVGGETAVVGIVFVNVGIRPFHCFRHVEWRCLLAAFVVNWCTLYKYW